MYGITIGLSYNEPLAMDTKYRYDFVCFDFEPKFGKGPLDGSVIVFRTISEGEVAGNVLIDFIDHSNVNAFDIALHGNAHIHMLNIDSLIEQKTFSITDKITIQATKNTLHNIEFQALIKEQKYEIKRDITERIPIDFKEIKYILFTKYHEDIANMGNYHIAPIFKLQKEHIWCNNRWWNFNDLTKIDIDNNRLETNTPWGTVQEIIKNERKKWNEKQKEKFHELLNAKKLHHSFPIER